LEKLIPSLKSDLGNWSSIAFEAGAGMIQYAAGPPFFITSATAMMVQIQVATPNAMIEAPIGVIMSILDF